MEHAWMCAVAHVAGGMHRRAAPVIMTNMVKEGLEDMRRHKMDEGQGPAPT